MIRDISSLHEYLKSLKYVKDYHLQLIDKEKKIFKLRVWLNHELYSGFILSGEPRIEDSMKKIKSFCKITYDIF
jgi:hypothetical protein